MDELERLRAANARLSRALDAALADAKRAREHAATLEARSALLRRRLEAARRSVSFRLGRATRVALDSADPRKWLTTFRGDDEILEEMAEDAPVETAPNPVDPDLVLAGAPPLKALVTLRDLTPHGWTAALERDPPSLVLVRAEDLAVGSPWGDWGTPGGRDGRALLGELVAWCRARAIAVAYQGAAPPALAFDLVIP